MNLRSMAVVALLVPLTGFCHEVRPQPRAHAHNDYAHRRPLEDALEHGFCSVEADIFLDDGRLLVAHEQRQTRADRTLEALYLEPLRKRASENGGRIYRDGPPFWLLVDIKSNAEETYRALGSVLERYADILTDYRSGQIEAKAVHVVVSGNRPRELMAAERVRYAAMDGRLSDLASSDPASLLPWISDNWTLAFRWRGVGEMPEDERRKLHDIVHRAHQQHRLVRFWATPELPALWRELVAAEVDFINTDDLAGLNAFLSAR